MYLVILIHIPVDVKLTWGHGLVLAATPWILAVPTVLLLGRVLVLWSRYRSLGDGAG